MIKEGQYPLTREHIDADTEIRYNNDNPITRALKDALGPIGVCVWPLHECIMINQVDVMTTTIFEDWYADYMLHGKIEPCLLEIFKQDDEDDDRFWITVMHHLQVPYNEVNEEFRLSEESTTRNYIKNRLEKLNGHK